MHKTPSDRFENEVVVLTAEIADMGTKPLTRPTTRNDLRAHAVRLIAALDGYDGLRVV